MAELRKAKTLPEAAALMHKLDKAYRAKHAIEIKGIIESLAK